MLASASPRRRELLAAAGYEFDVDATAIDERPPDGIPPRDAAIEIAARKADDVARRRAAGEVVLAADTMVVIDGGILGKPRDDAEARRMLRALAGRRHTVVTGWSLVRAGGADRSCGAAETAVEFRALEDREIDAYVATGEPRDKAGAYAIQGIGAHLVRRIEGSHSNVIGLPLVEIVEALRAFARLEPLSLPTLPFVP